MAMGIGVLKGTQAYKVLKQFVSNEEQVFDASNASEISEFFQYVTISTTSRTTSANPNMIPSLADVTGKKAATSEIKEEEDDDLGGLLPF